MLQPCAPALGTILLLARLSMLLVVAALVLRLPDACAFGKPTVAVKEVQVQGIDREHLRLRVVLTMDNSNPLPIPLSRIQVHAPGSGSKSASTGPSSDRRSNRTRTRSPTRTAAKAEHVAEDIAKRI